MVVLAADRTLDGAPVARLLVRVRRRAYQPDHAIVYVFTAFWSGQAGSMLFWALILSMYGTIAIATSRRRNRELVPWAAGTVSAILLFFVATTCFKANPFVRLRLHAARRRAA